MVKPLKSLLAARTEGENHMFCRKPRKPLVSTGVLRMSRTSFDFLSLEKGRKGIRPRIDRCGRIMVNFGLNFIRYTGNRKNNAIANIIGESAGRCLSGMPTVCNLEFCRGLCAFLERIPIRQMLCPRFVKDSRISKKSIL